MASVILEGADGTGKTTLAKIIAAKYGWDVCHCTGDDPKDFEFYKQTARKQNVVWDRHTIGELIYPEVFDRKPEIYPEDARIILAYAKEAGAKIFVLTADINDIRQRLKKRGEAYPQVWNRIEWINERFVFFANYLNIKVINTSEPIDYRELFETIEVKENFTFIHK